MNYTPGAVPSDPALIPDFLQRELSVLSRTLQGKTSSVWLAPLHVAPEKPRDGQIVEADGTNWDPGYGQGPYCYFSGTWNYIGDKARAFVLASDAATTATVTPVNLTGLVWTFAANAVYRFSFMGQVSPAAATTGCGFQLDVSAAVGQISMSFYHQLENAGTLSGGNSIADDASVGVSSGMPATSNYPVIGHGMLTTVGNTGTAQLRFRSETTAVTTCKAGFALVVERLS